MIEPDRMLEGLAATLEESVLPAVGSGFARGQLHAVLEVLGSLRGQLQWGGLLLESEASSIAALLDEVAGSASGSLRERILAWGQASSAPLAERLVEGRGLVCELIEAGLADEGPGKAAVDAWLANDTIFKAMALPAGRLAEISQG